MVNGENLANNLIDNYCDAYGIDDCIGILQALGYSKKELIEELNFDKEIVKAYGEE